MAAKRSTDDVTLTVARGLAVLTLDKRFTIEEADAVSEALAALISVVGKSRELEQRVVALERTTAAPPKLKAV
jgi:hypothetical protein